MSSLPTWDDLSVSLGVSVRNFHRWKKVPGSPQTPDREAWRTWMTDNGKGASEDGDLGPGELPGDCDYDAPVRDKTISLSDALKREQVKEQMIINDTRAVELEKAREDAAIRRGLLLTKEQVAKRDERLREIILGNLQGVVDLTSEFAAPEKKADARERAKAWIADVRAAMAEAVRTAL